MNFTKTFTAAAAALMATSLASGPAAAEDLRFLMPWGPSSEGNTAVGDLVMRIVEEESGGEYTLRKFDNSVVPPFEQFEPVASGVFDIHYTNPAYHSGATVMGQLMDSTTADTTERRESGLWDMVDEAYQDLGVKVLAIAPSTGYHFLLREPIGEDGGLEGRKIRSNPAYDGTIEALGGSPIQLPIPEVYTALQKSLIDGTAYPIHGVASAKMYEVVDYMTRPTFGQGTYLILMNLDKWNSLSEEDQELFLEIGRRFEQEAYETVSAVAARDEAEMKAQGTEISEFGPEYATSVRQIYNEATWERAIGNGGAAAEEMVEFIKANELVYTGPVE